MFTLTINYTDDKSVYETKSNVVQIFDLLCKCVSIDLQKVNIKYVTENGQRYGMSIKFITGVQEPSKYLMFQLILRFLRIIVFDYKVYSLTLEQWKTFLRYIKYV